MAKGIAPEIDALMEDLRSREKDRQNRAFQALLEMTSERVDWAYEIWDDVLELMAKGDNRQRSIVGQVLSNLAKSDPQGRILADFGALLALTRDERFVTARHCLLSLWKVAAVDDRHRKLVMEGLAQRFRECAAEKNCTLIRYDIECVLKRIYDLSGDEGIRSTGEKLMELETDPKYRKKYGTAWRSAGPAQASS